MLAKNTVTCRQRSVGNYVISIANPSDDRLGINKGLTRFIHSFSSPFTRAVQPMIIKPKKTG